MSNSQTCELVDVGTVSPAVYLSVSRVTMSVWVLSHTRLSVSRESGHVFEMSHAQHVCQSAV